MTLSELDEDECIAFIQSHGVSIPEELSEYEDLGVLVKHIITLVEQNPSYHFVLNYKVTLDFANEIKAVVNSYYGIVEDQSLYTIQRSSYTLKDNIVVVPWEDYYLNFNCYAYALKNYTVIGAESFYYPGSFSGAPFRISSFVSEWASNVRLDLKALNYDCILSSTNPSDIIVLSDHYDIICLRKCSTVGLMDYHFMRLDNSGYWVHKPGKTSPLRFKYQPYTKDWSNEYFFVDSAYEGDRWYTGTIYYFAYSRNHCYLDSYYTGNHYHSERLHFYERANTCIGCGNITYTWVSQICSGPPCSASINSDLDGVPICI